MKVRARAKCWKLRHLVPEGRNQIAWGVSPRNSVRLFTRQPRRGDIDSNDHGDAAAPRLSQRCLIAHAAPFRALLFAIALLVCSIQVNAADWTHWRGPEQNGVSRELGLISDWSLDGKNILWQSPIGGRATPIVLDGRVYLNCRTNANSADPRERIHVREQVVCRDAASGKLLWKDEFNVFQTDIAAERVGWASMAGDRETGNVYVHSVCGLFRCYSRDGDLVWEHSLLEEYGKISGFGGRTQSPIVDEDRVIISFLAANWGETRGPAPKHFYYAFDKRTGKLLWVSAVGGRPHDTNYSVPIVKVIGGTRMLIGGNADGGCYAINARTGVPIWGFRMSKRGINASPVSDGKFVYIAHGEDNIDNREFGRIQCIDASGHRDVTATHSVWRIDGIKAGYASLLVQDGMLYVVADTGVLYAFDSKSGQKLWEHNLGTMGRGSPVWADGKLYVTEVHGNVHILRPNREKCEALSHVYIPASTGDSYDGIFASPAISDGRVYIVTRDRTICLGSIDGTQNSDSVPVQPQETVAESKVAHIKLVPFETTLRPGESVEFEVRSYDKNGRFLKKSKPKLRQFEGLIASKVTSGRLTALPVERESAGSVLVEQFGLTASARVRISPRLPWKWDFDDYRDGHVPPTWIRAFGKLRPTIVDESTAMLSSPGKGRPSTYIWLGDPSMNGYTIQADVMSREQRRRMSNIGITAQRYNLILKGNTSRLEIQSWAPQLRMAREISFRWDPDVWYTMKMRVEIRDGHARVKGKVWDRSKKEPDALTIEAVDPHPNEQGSPGLYIYTLADCYFDNVLVTREQ